jgi:DNA repair photolyase
VLKKPAQRHTIAMSSTCDPYEAARCAGNKRV